MYPMIAKRYGMKREGKRGHCTMHDCKAWMAAGGWWHSAKMPRMENDF
jgi:hypothetical protein